MANYKIAVDIGNTRAKMGIFLGDELIEKSEGSPDLLVKHVEKYNPEGVVLVSVTGNEIPYLELLHKNIKVLKLSYDTDLPIEMLYESPETLGMDRIAAVVGASVLFPKTNALVIDAGSCITFDFIDEKGQYHGGAISPGWRMRYRAMNAFTARLPMLEIPEHTPDLTGKTTTEAMHSGVFYSLKLEIEGIIRMYADKFPNLQSILTGGDGPKLQKTLKIPVELHPELVLLGLNRIWSYHVE